MKSYLTLCRELRSEYQREERKRKGAYKEREKGRDYFKKDKRKKNRAEFLVSS